MSALIFTPTERTVRLPWRCLSRGRARQDPIFAAILERRTCKKAFTDQPLVADAAEKLQQHATLVLNPHRVARLKQIVWQAWRTEAFHSPSWTESAYLMRFGKTEINAKPDGIDLSGPFLEGLMLVGILTRAAQKDTNSSIFQKPSRCMKICCARPRLMRC